MEDLPFTEEEFDIIQNALHVEEELQRAHELLITQQENENEEEELYSSDGDEIFPVQESNISDAMLNFTNYEPDLTINIPPIPTNTMLDSSSNYFLTPPTTPRPPSNNPLNDSLASLASLSSPVSISSPEPTPQPPSPQNSSEEYNYNQNIITDNNELIQELEEAGPPYTVRSLYRETHNFNSIEEARTYLEQINSNLNDDENEPESQETIPSSQYIPYFPSNYQNTDGSEHETDTEDRNETKYIEQKDCSVCYKKLNTHRMVCTPCNHTYCVDCFFKWLKESKTCAMCRANLVDYTRWQYDSLPRRTSEEFRTFRTIFKRNRTLMHNNYKADQKLLAVNELIKTSMNDLIRRKEQGEFTDGYNSARFELLSSTKLKDVYNMWNGSPYKKGFFRGFYEKHNIQLKPFYYKKHKYFVKTKTGRKKIVIKKRRTQNTLFEYGFQKHTFTDEFLINKTYDGDGNQLIYKRMVYIDHNGVKHLQDIEDSVVIS
tara:strand:+ start:1 stop:1467 length:1467 start_codon:yes stop_codon:yes gene_type:complete